MIVVIITHIVTLHQGFLAWLTQHFLVPLQVLELDVRDVRIVEERSSAAAMETTSGAVSLDPLAGHAQRKHFLYFRDEKIFAVLMEICRTLGQS